MAKKSNESKVAKEKTPAPYKLIFSEISTGKHGRKNFKTIATARKWALDKVGPEFKCADSGAVVSNCSMKCVFPHGLTARQLMVDAIPESEKRSSGSLKERARAKRYEVIGHVIQCISDSMDTDIVCSDALYELIDEAFQIKIRKEKK